MQPMMQPLDFIQTVEFEALQLVEYARLVMDLHRVMMHGSFSSDVKQSTGGMNPDAVHDAVSCIEIEAKL